VFATYLRRRKFWHETEMNEKQLLWMKTGIAAVLVLPRGGTSYSAAPLESDARLERWRFFQGRYSRNDG